MRQAYPLVHSLANLDTFVAASHMAFVGLASLVVTALAAVTSGEIAVRRRSSPSIVFQIHSFPFHHMLSFSGLCLHWYLVNVTNG